MEGSVDEIGEGKGRGDKRRGVVSTKVNYELKDLKSCDPLLPPDLDAARALVVVPTHDDMDHQVEIDGNPGNRRLADQ